MTFHLTKEKLITAQSFLNERHGGVLSLSTTKKGNSKTKFSFPLNSFVPGVSFTADFPEQVKVAVENRQSFIKEHKVDNFENELHKFKNQGTAFFFALSLSPFYTKLKETQLSKEEKHQFIGSLVSMVRELPHVHLKNGSTICYKHCLMFELALAADALLEKKMFHGSLTTFNLSDEVKAQLPAEWKNFKHVFAWWKRGLKLKELGNRMTDEEMTGVSELLLELNQAPANSETKVNESLDEEDIKLLEKFKRVSTTNPQTFFPKIVVTLEDCIKSAFREGLQNYLKTTKLGDLTFAFQEMFKDESKSPKLTKSKLRILRHAHSDVTATGKHLKSYKSRILKDLEEKLKLAQSIETIYGEKGLEMLTKMANLETWTYAESLESIREIATEVLTEETNKRKRSEEILESSQESESAVETATAQETGSALETSQEVEDLQLRGRNVKRSRQESESVEISDSDEPSIASDE